MAVLKYKNADGQWEVIPHVIQGNNSDGYKLTDEDKNEIAGLVEAVSYSQSQNLTDEQKETARNNIGAVDASLVTDNVNRSDQIPNGNGLVNFFVSKQLFLTEQKQTARENIGAISQAELDEAVANIGNAPNKEWKMSHRILMTKKRTQDVRHYGFDKPPEY